MKILLQSDWHSTKFALTCIERYSGGKIIYPNDILEIKSFANFGSEKVKKIKSLWSWTLAREVYFSLLLTG